MGLDNPLHIAILLLIVLMVFGAKRLPELGRSLGQGMRGFKDSVSGNDTTPPVLESAPISTATATEPVRVTVERD
jgi:sec-independent protein translocase protein TatA